MEKFLPKPPARPGGQKDKLARTKEAAMEKLLANYESIVDEAKVFKRDERGLELLDLADRELDKMQRVKKAETLSEILDFFESGETFEQEEGGLTREQLDALNEVFGVNNLRRVELPDPAELTPAYFYRMYPDLQRTEDTKRGLISNRRKWDLQPGEGWPIFNIGIKGQAIMRSMKQEAEMLSLRGAAIYAEFIQKPNLVSDSPMYGSIQGSWESLDGLVPIIKKCFGGKATRFEHSYDELTKSFLNQREMNFFVAQRQKKEKGYQFRRMTLLSPLEYIEREIKKKLKEKRLAVPGFEVMLEPALVFNRQTTEQAPGNSQTNTEEITSTMLIGEFGKESGHYFTVGDRSKGGASQVEVASSGSHSWARGFRIAILLLKEPQE